MEKSIHQLTTKASITIEIEELSIAAEPLPRIGVNELVSKYGRNVKTVSDLPLELVDGGRHPFLGGMYQAYSDHRPFTVSPEMIWLVIQQGISIHLYHNVSQVIKYYPELIEKKALIIKRDKIPEQNTEWREIISFFNSQMTDYVDSEFIRNFSCNFSKSTLDEMTVGELMVMDAMQPYFEYIVRYCICGIPSVTIEGTASDWDKIISKINYFKKLDLIWWFDKIEPIIRKIKDTINGNLDRSFWMNMFKVHTKEEYGKPKVIDGWITQFYPYDKKGSIILNKEMKGLYVEKIFDTLPSEIKTIPFRMQMTSRGEQILGEYPMEFSAGFIGLSQDEKSKRLRPEIGWFVGQPTSKDPKELPYDGYDDNSREYFSLEAFPMELLEGDEYRELILHFKNEITYPAEIANLNTESLMMNGDLKEGVIEDLKNKFKNSDTRVMLNYIWEDIKSK